jgi:hypothetical protein
VDSEVDELAGHETAGQGVSETASGEPTCPFCDSRACDIVGATGIGKKVTLLRCRSCDREWDEVLMFRYRRQRQSDQRARPFAADPLRPLEHLDS